MIWRIWPVKSSFRFKGTVSHPVCRNPAPDRLFYPPGTATHSSRRVSFLLPFAWYVLYSWAGYPHLVLIEFLSLGGYFTCRKEGCTEASYYRRVQLRSARPQSTRIVQAEWSRNGANVAQSPVHCSKKGREWSNKTDTRFVVKSVLLRITTEQTWTRTSSALMLPFPGFSISVGESSGDPFLFRWMWFFLSRSCMCEVVFTFLFFNLRLYVTFTKSLPAIWNKAFRGARLLSWNRRFVVRGCSCTFHLHLTPGPLRSRGEQGCTFHRLAGFVICQYAHARYYIFFAFAETFKLLLFLPVLFHPAPIRRKVSPVSLKRTFLWF